MGQLQRLSKLGRLGHRFGKRDFELPDLVPGWTRNRLGRRLSSLSEGSYPRSRPRPVGRARSSIGASCGRASPANYGVVFSATDPADFITTGSNIGEFSVTGDFAYNPTGEYIPPLADSAALCCPATK